MRESSKPYTGKEIKWRDLDCSFVIGQHVFLKGLIGHPYRELIQNVSHSIKWFGII